MRIPRLYSVGLLLTVSFSLSILTSCALVNAPGQEALLAKSHSQYTYTEPGLSKYTKPVDLTFVRETSEDLDGLLRNFPGESLEDNRWTRLYEEVLGIRIKYDWMAKSDLYHQKLGVTLAAGNLPETSKCTLLLTLKEDPLASQAE